MTVIRNNNNNTISAGSASDSDNDTLDCDTGNISLDCETGDDPTLIMAVVLLFTREMGLIPGEILASDWTR